MISVYALAAEWALVYCLSPDFARCRHFRCCKPEVFAAHVHVDFSGSRSKMSQPSFSAFYEAMHGYAPFPWQVRLAERAAAGQWPTALNLPTASGKTAVVDVWLWAHTVGVAGTPRRLYYVIDRRLLVDAVADYAQALVAQCPLLPVSVVRLRGGMGAAEDAWMLNPGGLALVSTTLDQVGSRLLCRAYGSSRWTAPVHAGLVGNDALIVLDEAHLVEPFRQTLHSIQHSALAQAGQRARAGPLACTDYDGHPAGQRCRCAHPVG